VVGRQPLQTTTVKMSSIGSAAQENKSGAQDKQFVTNKLYIQPTRVEPTHNTLQQMFLWTLSVVLLLWTFLVRFIIGVFHVVFIQCFFSLASALLRSVLQLTEIFTLAIIGPSDHLTPKRKNAFISGNSTFNQWAAQIGVFLRVKIAILLNKFGIPVSTRLQEPRDLRNGSPVTPASFIGSFIVGGSVNSLLYEYSGETTLRRATRVIPVDRKAASRSSSSSNAPFSALVSSVSTPIVPKTEYTLVLDLDETLVHSTQFLV
jgi:hypothetical protein